MRIILDATALLTRSAGVKTQMFYWIEAMRRHAGRDRIGVFPPVGRAAVLAHEGSAVPRWRTGFCNLVVQFSNVRGNPALELVGAAADVFHASQHLYNPPFRFTRLTATIFDMTCWLMPEVHQPANVAATRRYVDRVLRRAAGCMAISEHSKRDAVEVLGLDERRIHVIYPGVADAFFSAGPAEAAETARNFGLPRPYVLFVGMVEPRKNIDRLLDAWRLISPSAASEHELVIAGPLGWISSATASRLRNPEPGIRYIGYVAERDLPGLTAGAAAFAFPSLYEGFGLPPAQAMACGTPVVMSRTSALGEIGRDAAVLVDPLDVEDIAAGIDSVLQSSDVKRDLSARGRARAQQFRWEDNAARSLAFFRRVAEGETVASPQ